MKQKKLNFMHYFDMFIAQTESFCRHHWKHPALFLFDPGIKLRFYFSDKITWLRILPFFFFFFFFLSDIFTFLWLHCTFLTRNGRSYFSNVINLIPDWLRQ